MFIKLLVIIIKNKKTERDILRFIFIGIPTSLKKTKEIFLKKKNEENKLLSYKL